MNTSRLLIAVSSPWAGGKLVEPIADMARRLDAEVVVAHVTQLQDEDEQQSDATRRGEQTLQTFTDALRESGVDAEGVILYSDDVVKAILNTARAHQCTLLVLGLTGKGALKRLIAGDVPGNLIRRTDLPVLLCPAGWHATV